MTERRLEVDRLQLLGATRFKEVEDFIADSDCPRFRYSDVLSAFRRLRTEEAVVEMAELPPSARITLARGLHRYGWGQWRDIRSDPEFREELGNYKIVQITRTAAKMRELQEFPELVAWEAIAVGG